MLLGADGDGSTLNLDFTTGVLDSRLTFTRASTTATYINSSGYVTTAGTNVARFDHDPTTQAPRGLLVEGTSTNLLNWSESFATSGGSNNHWNDQHISRTTGQTDPANTTTAIRFECHPGNATVISSAAIGTSAARTFSVWLRRVTGTGDIQYTQNNGTNWTTQAITSTWTRYSFTHTANHQVGIRIVTNGDAIEMWGAQLETGSGASSYIPTGASQATRVADSCVMTGTNFSSWYQSATAGTVYSEFDNPRANLGVAQTPAPANLGDYSAGNLLSGYLGGYPVGTAFAAAVWGNGGTDFQAATVATAGSVALGNKGAFAFAGQSIVGAFRGFSSATATTTGIVNAKTVLYIGANGTGGTSTRDFLNSCIQRIKFFPTQYTAAQLQALTT
jgi:hypothetical protein